MKTLINTCLGIVLTMGLISCSSDEDSRPKGVKTFGIEEYTTDWEKHDEAKDNYQNNFGQQIDFDVALINTPEKLQVLLDYRDAIEIVLRKYSGEFKIIGSIEGPNRSVSEINETLALLNFLKKKIDEAVKENPSIVEDNRNQIKYLADPRIAAVVGKYQISPVTSPEKINDITLLPSGEIRLVQSLRGSELECVGVVIFVNDTTLRSDMACENQATFTQVIYIAGVDTNADEFTAPVASTLYSGDLTINGAIPHKFVRQ